jgi:hypothetical protein
VPPQLVVLVLELAELDLGGGGARLGGLWARSCCRATARPSSRCLATSLSNSERRMLSLSSRRAISSARCGRTPVNESAEEAVAALAPMDGRARMGGSLRAIAFRWMRIKPPRVD